MPNTKNVRNFESLLRVGGLVTKKAGKIIGEKVINKTGVTIAADKLVAISGFDVTSKLPKIVLADNDAADLATDVYVALGAISDGKEGNVYKGGRSAANLNTNFGTVGDPVYLDATAGGFTGTVPTDSNAVIQVVGYTLVKSATIGQIQWNVKHNPTKIGDLNVVTGTKVLAATATTTTNVLASLTGFSWTLQAGGTYQFDVMLATTQTTNGGLAVALKYTTATMTSIEVLSEQKSASAIAVANSTTTTDATKFVDNKTAVYLTTQLKGTMVVGTGGSVAVQFAQNTTNSDTTSILLGSYATFTKVL